MDQAYTSADYRLFVVGHGETGWFNEVGGELLDCLGGDLALEFFLEELDALYEGTETPDNLAALITSSAEKMSMRAPGSSVVAVGLLFTPDGSQVNLVHAGDCRAYLLRDRRLDRLTQDHTVAEDLVRADKITKAQMSESPFKSFLTRVVGQQLDQLAANIEPGDRLFLCTAGLWHIVQDEELTHILTNQSKPFSFIEKLSVERDAERGWSAALIDVI